MMGIVSVQKISIIPGPSLSILIIIVRCRHIGQIPDHTLFFLKVWGMKLAKRLIDKNVITINDRGTYFDRENVERMLRQRELSMQMAALGLHTGMSYSTYSNKDVQKFASCFEKACMEMLKRQSFL